MARPLGNWKVKKVNIAGIIHSIMLLVDCCWGSAVGMVLIFCCTHMEAPTRTGNIGVGSGFSSCSHKKSLFIGMAEYIPGIQE